MMAQTRRLFETENFMRDAYSAILLDLNRRAENPKKPRARRSIWDIEDDTEISDNNSTNRDENFQSDNLIKVHVSQSTNSEKTRQNSNRDGIWGHIDSSEYRLHCARPDLQSPNSRYYNKLPMKTTFISSQSSQLNSEMMDSEISQESKDFKDTDIKNPNLFTSSDNLDISMDLVTSRTREITPQKSFSRKKQCLSDVYSDRKVISTKANLTSRFIHEGLDQKAEYVQHTPPKVMKRPDDGPTGNLSMRSDFVDSNFHQDLPYRSPIEKPKLMKTERETLFTSPLGANSLKENIDWTSKISSEGKNNLNVKDNMQDLPWRRKPLQISDVKMESKSNDTGIQHLSQNFSEKTKKIDDHRETNFNWRGHGNDRYQSVSKNETSQTPNYLDWLKEREKNWKIKKSDCETANSKNDDTLDKCKINGEDKGKSDDILYKHCSDGDLQKSVSDKSKKSIGGENDQKYDGKKCKESNDIRGDFDRGISDNEFKKNVNDDKCDKNISDNDKCKKNVTDNDNFKKIVSEGDNLQKFDAERNDLQSHKENNYKKFENMNDYVTAARLACSYGNDFTVCIQVTGGNGSTELTVHKKMLEQIRLKYPKLAELIPFIDDEKQLSYSPETLMILMRYLFFNTYKIPNWKVAVEVLSFCKIYNLTGLRETCEQYFSQNQPPPNIIEEVTQYANHFQVIQNLRNIIKFDNLSEFQSLCNSASSSQFQIYIPTCTISSVLHIEPMEFCIPLYTMKQNMKSVFQSDIRNELLFTAIEGTFCLTGVQIKLNAGADSRDSDINIECNVSRGNDLLISEGKEKTLKPLIIINFDKKVIVKPREKAKICIMIEDIQPRICGSLRDLKLSQREEKNKFTATLSTNYTHPPLIFIEKLFYTVNA